MGEKLSTDENVTEFRSEILRVRSHMEEPDVDGKITLKLILRELWTEFIWLTV
jgi:hypothetical protein